MVLGLRNNTVASDIHYLDDIYNASTGYPDILRLLERRTGYIQENGSCRLGRSV